MMASIGAVGQHFIKFPWAAGVHGTFGAMNTGEGVVGFLVLFMVSGVLELAWRDTPENEPGNFGDPFGVQMYTPEMRSKELSNGRMAMISMLGIFAAEMVTGKDAIEQFGLSALPSGAVVRSGRPTMLAGSTLVGGTQGRNGRVASALCAEPVTAAAATLAASKAGAAAKAATKTGAAVAAAAGLGSLTKGGKEGVAGTDTPKPSFNPAVQMGAMAPMGYFDPAGFCKKGDESGFRTFRAAEIKHGRVAMMAAVGAVAQHYVKFPGFEAVPSGLSAVTSAPGSYGMIALFLVAGALELGVWTEDPSKEPGNFGDPLGLGQYNDEMRAKELNNGRFAMFAAAGIIAAELVTGKDAIEQFGL